MDGLRNIEMLGIKNACSMKKMMMIIFLKNRKNQKKKYININITLRNNLKKEHEFKRKENACILVTTYVIIIEVFVYKMIFFSYVGIVFSDQIFNYFNF